MSGTKGMVHYSIEIKTEAVRLFLEEGYTYREIAKQLKIRLAEQIKVWVRQYRREGATAFSRPIDRPRKRAESEQGESERLRMENALLKKSVRIAQGYAREARYRTICRYQEEYPVTQMCTFLKVSRAAYYPWLKRSSKPDRDTERMKLIEKAFQALHHTYSYRRIQIWIQQKTGITINHKAVLRLMYKLGIHSVARRRKFIRTAEDTGMFHRYLNVLKREFSASRPNQKWVTDVTYIHTRQGWAYLSLIKDLHDGFVVAHYLTRQNSHELVMSTIKLARQKEMVTDGLILHSDQGYQYTSRAYFALTQEYNITPSMSRRGNCWDNAVIESFFGHLKAEAMKQHPNPTFEEAKQIIDDYV